MRTLRCKCGDKIIYTTDSPCDCQGCEICQTTYSGHPDHHQLLQPHEWGIRYNENTGKPYRICNKCHEIDTESYNQSKVKDADQQGKEEKYPSEFIEWLINAEITQGHYEWWLNNGKPVKS